MLLGLLDHGGGYPPGRWTMPMGSGGLWTDRVDPFAREEALGQMLASATSTPVRRRVRTSLRSRLGRTHKLRRLAETFAWGVRIGRQRLDIASGDNIEKAKLFGTLLAEAARGNRGVDVRLGGFTDRTIYDCGNAMRPAVHDLSPDNGNNDAAALWHAAQAACASRRKAKMLVMISDGSPTQCSVAALTALVQRLTRRMKILCAQVAGAAWAIIEAVLREKKLTEE